MQSNNFILFLASPTFHNIVLVEIEVDKNTLYYILYEFIVPLHEKTTSIQNSLLRIEENFNIASKQSLECSE